MEANHKVDYTQDEKEALIASMCGPLMTKVKLVILNAQKNRQLANNHHLNGLIELIGEHLLPQFCVKNFNDSPKLALMHNLVYLLASKVQNVFTSSVIKTCIDQNWDLKGYKSVLLRILTELGVNDLKKLQDLLEKMIQSQNLQSQSCIKAMSSFLKNAKKPIEEDDLRNPMVSFQTTFPFVKNDIQMFREQNMKYECFQVLHPWAYDLEHVDFKYILNKDNTSQICQSLKSSIHAQVFWLTYFKSSLSASTDEFISAIHEMCVMNLCPQLFQQHFEEYKKLMVTSDFVISVTKHADVISQIITQLTIKLLETTGFAVLSSQVRTKIGARQVTEYIDESKLQSQYSISRLEPDVSVLQKVLHKATVKVHQITEVQALSELDMKRRTYNLKPDTQQASKLSLKFTTVDTDELKDLEIQFDGNMAQFKVGEGDANHYVISNDKKLWESQFMIVNKGGRYYIRDLGIVHTSRLKVTNNVSLQVHQGALIDLGKVVHYHVDKLTHEEMPSAQSNEKFVVMRGSTANYKVDDEAMLRARPTWISGEESKDMVQNEIILEPSASKNVFSVGRSNRRDVEIKLKAVSADHCKLGYDKSKGWFIHELDKDKLSSNGTFVFMKSFQQMDDHEPSDLIPLFNGMTISFINYELQVSITPKSAEELARSPFEKYETAEPTPTPKVVTPAKQEITPVKEVTPINKVTPVKEVSPVKEPVKEVSPVKETHKEEPEHPYNEEMVATTQQKHHAELKEDHKYESPAKKSVVEEPVEKKESPVKQATPAKEEKKEEEEETKEDFVEEKVHAVHAKPEEKEEEEQPLEESPKATKTHAEEKKTPKHGEDEDNTAALLRSYSEHHIGEVVEKAKHDAPAEHKHEDQEEEPKKEATPEKKEASPEKKEVSPEKKSHTPEEKSPEKQEHTPEERESTPEKKKDDTPEKKEASPEKKEPVHEEKKDDTPEKKKVVNEDKKPETPVKEEPVHKEEVHHESPKKEEPKHESSPAKEVHHESPKKTETHKEEKEHKESPKKEEQVHESPKKEEVHASPAKAEHKEEKKEELDESKVVEEHPTPKPEEHKESPKKEAHPEEKHDEAEKEFVVVEKEGDNEGKE